MEPPQDAQDQTLGIHGDRVLWREVDGEIVALESRTWKYLTVNDTGKLLWGALAEGTTRRQLTGLLCSTYGIDPELAGRDVDAYLGELRSLGVLDEDG